MSKVLNKLIVRQMPWHANMTEANHLGAALIAKPDVFEGKMTQLFTSTRYAGVPLLSLLSAGKKETNSTQWEWSLKGANTRPLVVVEKLEQSNTPGLGRTAFKMKLDEPWYLAGDVMHPGTSNKKYQVRIQEVVAKQGNGTVYLVKPMSDDFSFFIPPQYLEAGTPWAKLYSQYEEAAEQSGSTQYALPLSMANRMGRYRKMYSVTGDAANEVLAVRIPDSNGKFHDSWIKYAEVEYWEQWYRELERGYWYSRSTDTVLGANGRPIHSGPGIQEMLEDGHVYRYSHLSTTLIEEYLMDIFYGRVKPGAQRKIKAFTGEYGMILFHRAIQDWAAKKGFIQVVDQYIVDKASSPYTSNGLAAGYQFVKYRMANGAELELVHQPLYDDREINFEIDPVTGYPVESMRFTFLDFSEGQGGPNIQLMDKANGFKLGYVSGLQNPYGPTNKSLMSHSGDYYEMHVQKQSGAHIEDVTKCGELILSRNSGYEGLR
jgi:hypothetical protein